ncbi:hypothetical protein PTRA_a0436 [Pseudoalteromonas translucida KMM 520]|uniref:Uncharacterized protein n=1 Tax=Pseudoalteromonas translucida KMM 520 TaxID=1315283 RepID=A0A0U2WZ86_9GAMM|nr:ATP-grasp fold amidoligase family protein [Pseudoalteromonas translucida]ALS31794.1 hypothetical protein PTRA_a0436 [Pseudoalteromonas translucida KMM 520]
MIKIAKKVKGHLTQKFPKLMTRVDIFYRHGYWPNFKTPRSFNEKIALRKLNPLPIYTELSDKYLVRKFVEKTIGPEYLIPLYKVVDRLCLEDLRDLPSNYVIKSNHASGSEHITIVNEESKLNKIDIVNKFKNSLLQPYGLNSAELHYKEIKRKVIIEKFISDNGKVPVDYKFHVFNKKGKTKWFLQIDIDRQINHKRVLLDDELKQVEFDIQHKSFAWEPIYNKEIFQMAELAKKLSSNFNYCRVDFYLVNGDIFFGEMTFTHGGGCEVFYPKAADFIFGDHWDYNG